jgi:hypothetical protein
VSDTTVASPSRSSQSPITINKHRNYGDQDDDVDGRCLLTISCSLLTPDCIALDFPPRNAEEERQLPDISDPWKGPQTFAEDFYSGGDIREGDLDPTVSPSNLTPFREERGNLATLLTPGLVTPAESTSITPAQLSPHHEVTDVDDDDVLPNSSPILSSPVDSPEEPGFGDHSYSPSYGMSFLSMH